MRKGTRFRRWTADTEIAFLMALRLTGSVTKACAEIGRSTHGACDRRNRMPDFAAKWQQVLDDWQADQAAERRAALGADDPSLMANRARYDGFTPLRQRAFLRALTETGKFQDACRHVGISEAAARNMRKRYPSFAEACDRALARTPATLEQAAFERAVEGIEEPVFHAGKQVGTRRRYSDSLMRQMLATRERHAREAAERQVKLPKLCRTEEEALASLIKKLETAERRVEDDHAESAAEEWRNWQLSWARLGRDAVPPRIPAQEVLPPVTGPEAGAAAKLRPV